ncbi:cyclic pyranopterin monophosphate synthase MoaC [uncultured Selenomonas sp.]|uniref:cyclic pyranopterin monophosphate synthase MoaC n=1 Tax=uncultured Selenomonas sp. TaxID=159275 RepID=UPI0025D6F76A|nr:cyclic pyranopterin monophosphate synthase MoaC [uncultured Selenomonas sp.]
MNETERNLRADGLTHFDAQGRAIMVDVSEKAKTVREATASGRIRVSKEVRAAIENGTAKKGNVLGVARIAGIMAAKETSHLIPLCHPLPLAKCAVEFDITDMEDKTTDAYVIARATVRTTAETGVEMEALTAVSVALLTVYDMCKAIDKRMEIGAVHLDRKTGGKSGDFVR